MRRGAGQRLGLPDGDIGQNDLSVFEAGMGKAKREGLDKAYALASQFSGKGHDMRVVERIAKPVALGRFDLKRYGQGKRLPMSDFMVVDTDIGQNRDVGSANLAAGDDAFRGGFTGIGRSKDGTKLSHMPS